MLASAQAVPREGSRARPKPAYSNLLHELVYALLGVCGDVFVDEDEEREARPKNSVRAPSRSAFRVTPHAAWLSASDRAQLEGILRTGFHYHEIDAFVTAHDEVLGDVGRNACWHGLCVGLQELCVVYQAAVLRVEQHILTDAVPTLASIQHYLSDFVDVLPAVHTILWELTTMPMVSNVTVMDSLYTRSRCGIPALQAVLERLFWNCNQVLYRHLSAWLIYGQLLNTGFDFFIASVDEPRTAAAASASAGGSEAGVAKWASFELHLGRVPKYLPESSPEKILDIGRAVRLLRHNRASRAAARSTAGAAAAGGGAGSEDDVLVTEQQLKDFSEQLRALAAAPTFSTIAFEHAIDKIAQQVGMAVYSLMVHTARLGEHVTAIKDFLLLGRGDLFNMFLEEAAPVLAQPPRESSAVADLAGPFRTAAAKTRADALPGFTNVRIHWTPKRPTLAMRGASADIPTFTPIMSDATPTWNSIQLSYHVPWPLPLLFRPESMAVYEALFLYLFAVARAVKALDDVWLHITTQARVARRRRDATHTAACRLRHRMAHVVCAVQAYLKEEVIEDGFAALLEAVAAAATFREVQRAHSDLLEGLKSHTFLGAPSVCERLKTVLHCCALLHGAVVEGAKTDLASIESRFMSNADLLIQALQSQRVRGAGKAAANLQKLLLKLGFNGYLKVGSP